MWTCPECSRTFKNTHQEHSCMLTDLESHFKNKSQQVKDIFIILKNEMLSYEGVRINTVKKAILFRTNYNFLAVKPKKEFVDIELILDEEIDEFPIHKTVQTTKTKWAHFIRLGSEEEVDRQLTDWIKRAYNVSE